MYFIGDFFAKARLPILMYMDSVEALVMGSGHWFLYSSLIAGLYIDTDSLT